MDQSINLFTQSRAVAPPPTPLSNVTAAPPTPSLLWSVISAWQKPSEWLEPWQTCGSVTYGPDTDGSHHLTDPPYIPSPSPNDVITQAGLL